MIIGIDPGPEASAYCLFDGCSAAGKKVFNGALLEMLRTWQGEHPWLAVEMIASYGMPVGRDIFETVFWAGRFWERWRGGATKVYRRDVKLHLCGSARAKDGNVRQALIDRLGKPGTKKAPGPTYGIAGDVWQALAVAVYHHDVNLSKGAA